MWINIGGFTYPRYFSYAILKRGVIEKINLAWRTIKFAHQSYLCMYKHTYVLHDEEPQHARLFHIKTISLFVHIIQILKIPSNWKTRKKTACTKNETRLNLDRNRSYPPIIFFCLGVVLNLEGRVGMDQWKNKTNKAATWIV